MVVGNCKHWENAVKCKCFVVKWIYVSYIVHAYQSDGKLKWVFMMMTMMMCGHAQNSVHHCSSYCCCSDDDSQPSWLVIEPWRWIGFCVRVRSWEREKEGKVLVENFLEWETGRLCGCGSSSGIFSLKFSPEIALHGQLKEMDGISGAVYGIFFSVEWKESQAV